MWCVVVDHNYYPPSFCPLDYAPIMMDTDIYFILMQVTYTISISQFPKCVSLLVFLWFWYLPFFSNLCTYFSPTNPTYRLNTYPFRAAPYKPSYDNWPASAAVLVHCVVPWTCCCCLLYWFRFLTPPSANLHSKGSSCPTQNEKQLYTHTGNRFSCYF